MTDQLSNADTAVRAGQEPKDDVSPVPEVVENPDILPPRTGYLRVDWYKRSGKYRPFPASAAAGCAVVGVSLFTISLVLLGTRHLTSPGLFTGLFLFSSGLVEIITGIWAVVDNNVWGSTFLLGYAAFFISLGTIEGDLFGIVSSYPATDLSNAIGIFLAAWTVFTFFLWTATIKSTVPLFALMTFLFFFFLLYTIAVFGAHAHVQKAAGVFGFLTAACAFYGMYDGLHAKPNAYLLAPEGKWTRMPGSLNQPTDERYVEIV